MQLSARYLALQSSTKDGGKRKFDGQLSELNLEKEDECFALVFASATTIRECKKCRSEMTTKFSVPKFWWSDYCKKSNGYFGMQDIITGTESSHGTMTWSRFHLKMVQGDRNYEWVKVTCLTHFLSPRNQVMLVFDPNTQTQALLLESLMGEEPNDELIDPFWVYSRILKNVVELYDQSIWYLRHLVRNLEKSTEGTGRAPNYRKLHDLARHAIHIVETTSVGTNTSQRIHVAHKEYMDESKLSEQPPTASETRTQKRIQNQLLESDLSINNLQERASATNKRLHNEIQLSFNLVVQKDSGMTLKMSRIAQDDSKVMRMIAFLTLTFLPATFVSAVFSTSFFNFNPDANKWTVSNKFWIFWVISVPITLLTLFMCHKWGLALPGEENKMLRKETDLSKMEFNTKGDA
ncbi:hypothetical protein NLG97_g3354 [Lecanicillium saksenae]|uniref:Uncharacterized protein n=1 Tax=Lecanicillium saksenae TaxID=468837 RepID=A0ACC1QYI6_9HYPO|nr:hypothetical protein NLG97_g3354 [Lecanicillium saksenae]